MSFKYQIEKIAKKRATYFLEKLVGNGPVMHALTWKVVNLPGGPLQISKPRVCQNPIDFLINVHSICRFWWGSGTVRGPKILLCAYMVHKC